MSERSKQPIAPGDGVRNQIRDGLGMRGDYNTPGMVNMETVQPVIPVAAGVSEVKYKLALNTVSVAAATTITGNFIWSDLPRGADFYYKCIAMRILLEFDAAGLAAHSAAATYDKFFLRLINNAGTKYSMTFFVCPPASDLQMGLYLHGCRNLSGLSLRVDAPVVVPELHGLEINIVTDVAWPANTTVYADAFFIKIPSGQPSPY